MYSLAASSSNDALILFTSPVNGLAKGPHWNPLNSGCPLRAHLKILG